MQASSFPGGGTCYSTTRHAGLATEELPEALFRVLLDHMHACGLDPSVSLSLLEVQGTSCEDIEYARSPDTSAPLAPFFLCRPKEPRSSAAMSNIKEICTD